MMRAFTMPAALLLVTAVAVGCSEQRVPTGAPDGVAGPQFSKQQSSSISEYLAELAADANARLEAEGINVRTERAFYFTESEEVGRTVFFDDRTFMLGIHFVPGDTRRFVGANTDIAYMVDQVDASNLPIATTTAAINRAMATWDGLRCSNIPITTLANPGFDIGFVFGGFPAFFLGADITHGGWVPLPFPVLGVSFPFGFVDLSGNFTDINNDGNLDVAFWEIFYSSGFVWADDGVSNIDAQTVALHEAGHGLDLGHFGTLFRTDKNGQFHFAPRTVMNAGYTGPQRTLRRTDVGGHCSIWSEWPNH